MNYLFEISVGPIQDFISAARRTRDLWFGSNMISEIAKAIAKSVKDSGGQLIFPAPKDDNELKPNSDLSVANIILAKFEDSDCKKLRAVSDEAHEAAKARLRDYAGKVFAKMKDYIVKDRWGSQLDDIIEFYSAWVPIDGDYHSARKNVARLLAGRKNIRDFKPSQCLDSVPKSSLDGLRESVLIQNYAGKELPTGVHIKPSEALDAIGLIKRVPNERDWVFPSVIRTALDTWIRGKGKELLTDQDFKDMCNELAELGGLSRANLPGDIYESFPYDGTVLLTDRHTSIIDDSRDKVEARKLCNKISIYIENSERPPEPYLAFLCADGDKMGAALSAMKSADEHRTFSRDLSSFALKARGVIMENHGICIYTGGDDVMAFLPLDTALDCARSLHDRFGNIMGKYGASLSVGVAIAHAMESLDFLLQFGRDAEKIAKKGIDGKAEKRGTDRNGLAVSVYSRGNIPFTVREQWKTLTDSKKLSEMSIEQRVKFFAKCFSNKEIPAKFPYELRENAKFYNNWPDDHTLKEAVVCDVKRIFKNKDLSLQSSEKTAFAEYIEAKVKDSATIREFADELILAQWIGR